jgi:hypothetical protein
MRDDEDVPIAALLVLRIQLFLCLFALKSLVFFSALAASVTLQRTRPLEMATHKDVSPTNFSAEEPTRASSVGGIVKVNSHDSLLI